MQPAATNATTSTIENAIVDAEFLLQKFTSKGGWTYAEVPQLNAYKNGRFGFVEVFGKIDDFVLPNYKLWPMVGGQFFLPLRAEIRKQIKKEAGDKVHIQLFATTPPRPKFCIADVIDCFHYEAPFIYQNFMAQPASEQKTQLDFVAQASSDETRVKRIVALIEKLERPKAI
jgi:hypothetical protein